MGVIELIIVSQNYVYTILNSSRSGLGASTAKVLDCKLYYYQQQLQIQICTCTKDA